MKKKIVLIDMDGTIVDFSQSFRKRVVELGWEIDEEKSENSDYVFIKNDPEYKKWISIISEEKFFIDMQPIDGAVEAVKEMMEDETLEIFFCSRPSYYHTYCVPEKYLWIEKYFGFDATSRMIMTREKTLAQGDFLIDDIYQGGGVVKPSWEQVYFTQPYNEELKGKRITDWSKWRDIIK